jgi:hypothetical protein
MATFLELSKTSAMKRILLTAALPAITLPPQIFARFVVSLARAMARSTLIRFES